MALHSVICTVLVALFIQESLSQSHSFNPAILQDSRDLPKVDGRFGFLYRTEDGIAHAAKGEPGGQVHGRFTYTDPTGLKVNFNYNAGTRTAPGYNYNEPLSSYEQDRYAQKSSSNNGGRQYQQAPQYPEDYDDGTYRQEPQQNQPQQEYEYRPQISQQSRSKPPSLRGNSINSY